MNKIIEVSDDQNTVKTDDGKEHRFVEAYDFECHFENSLCSLNDVDVEGIECRNYCTSFNRKDWKDGYFKLKGEIK